MQNSLSKVQKTDPLGYTDLLLDLNCRSSSTQRRTAVNRQQESKQGRRKRKSNKKERKKEKCKLGTHPRGGDGAGDARQAGWVGAVVAWLPSTKERRRRKQASPTRRRRSPLHQLCQNPHAHCVHPYVHCGNREKEPLCYAMYRRVFTSQCWAGGLDNRTAGFSSG